MNDELAKKADKVYVDAEFKKYQASIDKLNEWCRELEDLIK